jgi:hypothetical protein
LLLAKPPVAKPASLMTDSYYDNFRTAREQLIEKLTPPAALVIDPAAGDGEIGAASKRTGRRYIAVEADPELAALARKRSAEAIQVEDENTPQDNGKWRESAHGKPGPQALPTREGDEPGRPRAANPASPANDNGGKRDGTDEPREPDARLTEPS